MAKNDYSELPPIDETERSVQDVGEIVIPIDKYMVADWTDPNDTKPSQVHIVLTISEFDSDVGIAIRLKSKKAISALIQMLRRHRDTVWP